MRECERDGERKIEREREGFYFNPSWSIILELTDGIKASLKGSGDCSVLFNFFVRDASTLMTLEYFLHYEYSGSSEWSAHDGFCVINGW